MSEQRAHLGTWLVAGSVLGAALLGFVGEPGPSPFDGQSVVANGGGSGDNGNGKNNGVGNDKKDFTITGTATGLYPGAEKPLALTFANENNFPIKVTTFTATVASPSASCSGTNVHVDALPPDVVIPANGTTTTTVLVRMSNNPPNACKDATFGLTYTGTADKA